MEDRTDGELTYSGGGGILLTFTRWRLYKILQISVVDIALMMCSDESVAQCDGEWIIVWLVADQRDCSTHGFNSGNWSFLEEGHTGQLHCSASAPVIQILVLTSWVKGAALNPKPVNEHWAQWMIFPCFEPVLWHCWSASTGTGRTSKSRFFRF